MAIAPTNNKRQASDNGLINPNRSPNLLDISPATPPDNKAKDKLEVITALSMLAATAIRSIMGQKEAKPVNKTKVDNTASVELRRGNLDIVVLSDWE